jgi:hypothetical protein
MEEKQALQWTPEVETIFQTLKGAFYTAPVLACSEPGERFVIDTGAENVGIGGVAPKYMTDMSE